MVGENFDLGSPPRGYGFGEVALSVRDVSVADASGGGALVVDHLSLDVRAGRDRLHLRPDGRRTHRTPGMHRRARAEDERARSTSKAGRSPASPSPNASPRASCSCPRTASATAWCRPCRSGRTCRSPASARFAQASVAVAAAGADRDRPVDPRGPHQDGRRRRPDRFPVGRQPAEGRDRQGAGDPSQGHPARRAEPRHRHRRQGRSVQDSQPSGPRTGSPWCSRPRKSPNA